MAHDPVHGPNPDDPVIVNPPPAEAALVDEPPPETPAPSGAEPPDPTNLPVGLTSRDDQLDFHGERLSLALKLAHRAARDICRVVKGHRCKRKGKHTESCPCCGIGLPACKACELLRVVKEVTHYKMADMRSLAANARIVGELCQDPLYDFPKVIRRLERFHAQTIMEQSCDLGVRANHRACRAAEARKNPWPAEALFVLMYAAKEAAELLVSYMEDEDLDGDDPDAADRRGLLAAGEEALVLLGTVAVEGHLHHLDRLRPLCPQLFRALCEMLAAEQAE